MRTDIEVFVNTVFTKAYINIVWVQNTRKKERKKKKKIYTQQLSFICVNVRTNLYFLTHWPVNVPVVSDT